MTSEMQQTEYPYCVRIETSTGQSADFSVVFLTSEQVERFLQADFNRLVQEAGIRGARIHVERAMTADYDKVLRQVAGCLRTAAVKAA